MPWYFIHRVLKLAKVKMYVRNGYDGDSETVNVLAKHTALKRWIATEIRWYSVVVVVTIIIIIIMKYYKVVTSEALTWVDNGRVTVWSTLR